MSIATTLWDLLPKRVKKKPAPVAPERRPARRTPAADRYMDARRAMLKTYGVRVRKWRSSTSGVAWQVTYKDGTVTRLIESPEPKGPISAAVFLHEIGHHAIGFGVYRPRCLEEYHAWRFSLEKMRELGLPVTQRVHDRVHDALHYAVWKARRRGLKRLPEELVPFIESRGKQPAPELL